MSLTERWNLGMTATQISWKAAWGRLDPFDLGRLKAGEDTLHFDSYGPEKVKVSIVSSPVTSEEVAVIIWFEDGRRVITGLDGARVRLRMAPKPQERRTVYLNIYPNGSIIGHKNEDSADSGSNSRREGRAVPVHLVKGTDGNWQVETEAETDTGA